MENRIKKKQLELVCFQSEMKAKWFELLCNVEEEADFVFDTEDFEYGCEYRWRRTSIVYEAKEVLGYKTWMEKYKKERKEKEEREKKERLTRTNSKP